MLWEIGYREDTTGLTIKCQNKTLAYCLTRDDAQSLVDELNDMAVINAELKKKAAQWLGK
jgi:hypothetical protein